MNTTVVIIMIICATVIALVAIICDHLFERKSSETSENLMSKKIVKIHRNYIAGFLGFAIIMLLTAQYGGPDNAIFAYLSFGSTITSLVLSILAIFVTMQSSSDMYKQFSKMEDVTRYITSTSEQIKGTLGNLKDTEVNLQKTSDNISMQIDSIIDKIDERVKTRIKETEDNISKQLEESLNNIPQTGRQQIQSNADNIESVKRYFVNITSANGLLALYACALSAEKSKPFELTTLFQGNEAYTFGFLIACISVSIVNFTNDQMNNTITCTGSIFTSTELYEEIKGKVKQYGQDFLNKINIINKFYDIPEMMMTVE